MLGTPCQVCTENPSKYKCPTCKIPYCSLNCFKKHKEIPCYETKVQQAPAIQESQQKTSSSKDVLKDDDEFLLSQEQLRNLSRSEAIHDYLKHPQIRNLISAIDSSKDPAKMLDQARQNDPVFGKLVEEMLYTVTGKKAGEDETS
ncbi:hypothetical protein K450DRAFT_258373 [Umbelopsis ramanniana AG]|uniref:HIT-type domain-containing protein n=1 Tax=Umbelopsis ramanniana AG TaxID=1314678 RepID=A0AAD5E4A3_UMBRA|nr:uncharacterized protein K450DRAFT_258373 [Umbelopsis ramanniana AG]KAI8576080.1 hypothetical protein K450DRAFT_258373 [Umbelopsis ramanniana AG]